MTRKQLIQRTTGTQRLQLRGQKLRGFDFSGLDLTDADFSFSDLRRANFEGATLHGADLSFASLRGANFENADLTDANLSFGDVTNANLKGANLSGTKMNFSVMGANRNEKTATEPTTLPNVLLEPIWGLLISIPTLLQKPVWGLLLGSVLGALLFYGSSGIIFFTSKIVTSTDPVIAGLNRFIAWQNITEGVTIFILAWIMSPRLDRWFQTNWVRHLVFSVQALIVFLGVGGATYLLAGKDVIDALRSDTRNPNDMSDDSAPWFAYAAAGLLVGNMFLYVLRQGRQLTRKMSEQEYQLLNMEKLKNRAELDALQAKINPHFLYNALNSIASLVHEDPDKAEEMTLLLSKLFRYSTGRDGGLFTTLADELEMVRTYLRVEQVRFGDRLRFEVEGIESASWAQYAGLSIPQFLLQPLVENAIKHGIGKRADGGCIRVSISETSVGDQRWLWLFVHDNGPAFPDDLGGGYGLRSIQDKLRILYADDATFELQNDPQKQVRIGLKMTRPGGVPLQP